MEPKPDPLDPAVVTAVVREPTPDPMDPAAIAVSARPAAGALTALHEHRLGRVASLPLGHLPNTSCEKQGQHDAGTITGVAARLGAVAGLRCGRDGGGTVAGRWRDSGGTVQQGTSTFYRALVSQRMGRHEAQGS